jgi:hypothetical protein
LPNIDVAQGEEHFLDIHPHTFHYLWRKKGFVVYSRQETCRWSNFFNMCDYIYCFLELQDYKPYSPIAFFLLSNTLKIFPSEVTVILMNAYFSQPCI